MKSVITFILALLVTHTATANTKIGTRQDIIRTAVAGEIVSVNSLCPPNAVCITDGTVINLKFELVSACANLSLKYTVDEATNTVNVSAIEEVNAKMACIMVVPEPRMESISLVMVFPPMTLNFVGTGVSYDILPSDVNADLF